jgi:hypothetical protein
VAMKIRYLAVDLADDLFNLKEDRHVLIPLEAVELRERGQDVWVRDIGSAEIAALPAYTGGAVRPWLEQATDAAFTGGGQTRAPLPREDAPPERLGRGDAVDYRELPPERLGRGDAPPAALDRGDPRDYPAEDLPPERLDDPGEPPRRRDETVYDPGPPPLP